MVKSIYESPPPSRSRVNKTDAKEEIIILLNRSFRPLLIGTAALHLGGFWTLANTEVVFQELVDEGKIRELSSSERISNDLTHGYVLVKPHKIPT